MRGSEEITENKLGNRRLERCQKEKRFAEGENEGKEKKIYRKKVLGRRRKRKRRRRGKET